MITNTVGGFLNYSVFAAYLLTFSSGVVDWFVRPVKNGKTPFTNSTRMHTHKDTQFPLGRLLIVQADY